MPDYRHLNEEYAEIAQDLIDTEPMLEYIKNAQVSISYLSSDYKKIENGKKVHAQCEKVQEKYKWGIPADFTITVFEPNVIGFSKHQIRILLFHELLHVHIDYRDGEEKYSVNPHDLEDFRYIIDRFGSHWDEPEEEEKTDFDFGIKLNLGDLITQNMDHFRSQNV